eukprot:1190214-Rhodomonas_salina.1
MRIPELGTQGPGYPGTRLYPGTRGYPRVHAVPPTETGLHLGTAGRVGESGNPSILGHAIKKTLRRICSFIAIFDGFFCPWSTVCPARTLCPDAHVVSKAVPGYPGTRSQAAAYDTTIGCTRSL